MVHRLGECVPNHFVLPVNSCPGLRSTTQGIPPNDYYRPDRPVILVPNTQHMSAIRIFTGIPRHVFAHEVREQFPNAPSTTTSSYVDELLEEIAELQNIVSEKDELIYGLEQQVSKLKNLLTPASPSPPIRSRRAIPTPHPTPSQLYSTAADPITDGSPHRAKAPAPVYTTTPSRSQTLMSSPPAEPVPSQSARVVIRALGLATAVYVDTHGLDKGLHSIMRYMAAQEVDVLWEQKLLLHVSPEHAAGLSIAMTQDTETF